VIRRPFHAVTFTFDYWPWTFAVHYVLRDQRLSKSIFEANRTIRDWVIDDL